MAETSIQWADYTFNCWSGCTKVSAGCSSCYAEVNYSVKMRGVKWGPSGNRIVKAESGWKEPLKWDREAGKAFDDWQRSGDHEGPSTIPPARPRVFCASLADVFESWDGPMLASDGSELWRCKDQEPDRWVRWPANGPTDFLPHELANYHAGMFRRLTMQDVRDRLFRLIDQTPNLDWLLLTKRPENIAAMMPEWQTDPTGLTRLNWPRPNLWLGTSCENQQTADERIPHLLKVPASVRFLSCEPLLSGINLIGSHDEYQRAGRTSDVCDRDAVDGRTGPRLETPGDVPREQDRRARIAMRKTPSGYRQVEEGRIPSHPDNSREDPLRSGSASDRLDDREPTDDSSSNGNKSQGREEEQQQTDQSRSGRTVGQRLAFASPTERLSESDRREVDPSKSSRDPEIVRHESDVKGSDGEALRGERRDNPQRGEPLEVGLGSGLIDWVIVGGESGRGARACNVAWIREIVEQCKEANVACFVKQIGASPNEWDSAADGLGGITGGGGQIPLVLTDKKGGTMEEWPLDLRVREFPR